MAAKRARTRRTRNSKRPTGKATQVGRTPREHRIGAYVVDGRPIGRGGMAHVHRVRSRTGKLYAIKELRADRRVDREQVQRFKREFEVGSSLRHKHIVRSYDCFEANGTWHIRMELLANGSLEELIDTSEPFAPGLAAALALPLLSALEHAHRRGTVHRDIKPGNVLLTESFEPKLADFGIARVEETKLTRAGTMLGTPAYMAPEQLDGSRPDRVDGRADLHALAVLLYEMVTGRNPYGLGARADMLRAARIKREREARPAHGIDAPELAECLAKALARDPDERYGSAAEMRRALKPLAASSHALAKELRRRHRERAREIAARGKRDRRAAPTPPGRATARRRVGRALALVVGIAALAAAVVAARQLEPERIDTMLRRAIEWLEAPRGEDVQKLDGSGPNAAFGL